MAHSYLGNVGVDHVPTGSPVSNPMEDMEVGPLDGLWDPRSHQYKGIPDVSGHVQRLVHGLETGSTNQYLILRNVTKVDLDTIDKHRHSLGACIRLTYYDEGGLLIVKVPLSGKHEVAHRLLARLFELEMNTMDIDWWDLNSMGGEGMHAPNSTKESDTAYKPESRFITSGFPTLVFECGYSENINRLRADARWWLLNSRGDTKIVILISLKELKNQPKEVMLEEWCLTPRTTPGPATRNEPALQPTLIQTIQMVQKPPVPGGPHPIPASTITGAPLLLEFDKIFLRAPVPPEADIMLQAALLDRFVMKCWTTPSPPKS